MRFRHKLAVITALFCCTVASAQTTQFTGTIRDLTNTPVATGLVNFTLQPGADTTISGVGRFTPNTVTCSIVNQAISSISRAANVVTVTTSSAHGFTTGDLVNIVGVTDTSYNANGLTITVTAATTFTFAQTAGNSSSSGGFAGNLFKFGGTGACTVVNNLSLNPAGTSYKIQICPLFACTSQFNGYALGGVTDLTTIVPTPGTLPAFNFVDTFSNQTVAGNKTFSGASVFSGSSTFSNTNTFSAVNTFTAIPVFTLGISGVAGQTLNLPATADTLVGRNTTDTMSFKTFIAPVLGAATGTSLALGGDTAMSNSPRMTFGGYQAGNYNGAVSIARFTPDKAITITRVEVVSTVNTTCTVNPTVTVTGTNTATLTLATGTFAWDSGPISVNSAAGTLILIGPPGSSGTCTTPPANLNITVQYKMQ